MELFVLALLAATLVASFVVALAWISMLRQKASDTARAELLFAKIKLANARRMARVRAGKRITDDDQDDEDDDQDDDEEEDDRLGQILKNPMVRGFLDSRGIDARMIDRAASGKLDAATIAQLATRFAGNAQQPTTQPGEYPF